MSLKRFYLVAALAGTVIPWAFFAGYFAEFGPWPGSFVLALFANGAAGGFSADVLISILVFWIWSFSDARSLGVERWWLVLPASGCVGLSLALPLYLYLRADRAEAIVSPARTATGPDDHC